MTPSSIGQGALLREEHHRMNADHFDALSRLISTRQSRRSALAAVLAAVGLGPAANAVAAKRKRKRGTKKKNARNRQRRKQRTQEQRPSTRTEAVPATCCSSNACLPGPGTNLGKCCLEDQNLASANLKGANLSSANVSRSILTNANFRNANLSKTCFVDADVTGASFSGANSGKAIFCRTQTDDGEDNSGCDLGTPCCPTCDDAHPCGAGELCCDGRCVVGDCCDNGEQDTCDAGELCCAHICVMGVCCRAADCPNETCQRRTCEDHHCVYTPISGRTGPDCGTVCCQDATGAPLCCPEGATTCDAQGLCCAAQTREETCAVGSTAPKCGEVTNNCGQIIDCGQCAERICQEGSCSGPDNSCQYTTFFDEPGPQCPTLCCREASGNPECCADGTLQCFPSGGCRCANNQDCPAGEACCNGACETAIWANETTFGDGPRTDGGVFQNIIGVAISGNEQTAWVVDQGQRTPTINEPPRVSVWTRQANGQWENEAFFGSRGSGPGQFDLPYGVAVSDDGLTAFVSDQGSVQSQQGSRISVWRKQPDGSWTNPFSLGSGTGDEADQFRFPTGVAVSGDGRTLWVVDTGNDRVSVWRESNGSWAPLTTFGSEGVDPGQFSDPTGIAVSADGQTAWVIDRIRTRVTVWTRQANGNWTFDTEFGSFGDQPDQWRGAQGVAVAADGQTAFVADLGHDRIMIWTRQPNGDWVHDRNLGNGEGSGRDQFDGPFALAVSTDGRRFWVSDQGNFRVSIWSLGGCPAP
jgi:uncharacterized protein YjbI with pentapeptide repeats/DNA-binding beta-propeller fold protein YncE